MVERMDEYIRSGDYPEWPYRGAKAVERLYLAKALPGVLRLIAAFRDDPEVAQASFDQLFQTRTINAQHA
jgi:hypothetical protein